MTDNTDTPTTTPKRRRRIAFISAAVLVVAAAAGGIALTTSNSANPAPTPTRTADVRAGNYVAPSLATVVGLPLADYKAVIGGLIPVAAPITGPVKVGTVTTITPLYGSDKATAVARLDKLNPFGQPVTVVVVKTAGDWSKILTPARVQLPSKANKNAPAQSAAWVRTKALTGLAEVHAHVEVSVSKLTLTVTGETGAQQVFPAAVGTKKTPTPTNVTGYLQARYVDPTQGTGTHPIQLTTLHSAAEDAPVDGGVGGLIAVHYFSARTGAISHGCIRVGEDAIAAMNAIPLGSLITITP